MPLNGIWLGSKAPINAGKSSPACSLQVMSCSEKPCDTIIHKQLNRFLPPFFLPLLSCKNRHDVHNTLSCSLYFRAIDLIWSGIRKAGLKRTILQVKLQCQSIKFGRRNIVADTLYRLSLKMDSWPSISVLRSVCKKFQFYHVNLHRNVNPGLAVGQSNRANLLQATTSVPARASCWLLKKHFIALPQGHTLGSL